MTDTILWDKCLDAFNSVLSEKQMRTWFHPLEVIIKDKTLNVVAPNKFVKDVIENDFLLLIKDTVLRKSSNQVSEILLSLPTPQNTERNKFDSAATNKKHQTSLNKDLTFENFVEGKSNQLAKAACSSVVTKLGQYNPLYIYGGVGLGKTHLLHSIGNEIIKVDKSKKVVYLHSEKFVQNMVTALRQNKIEEFKKYYLITEIYWICIVCLSYIFINS